MERELLSNKINEVQSQIKHSFVKES